MTRLDALFRRIADEQDAFRQRAPSTERLVARIRAARPPQRRARLFLRLSMAAVVAVVAGTIAVIGSRSTLSVKVADSAGVPLLGTWLGVPERKSLSLEFSDGSRFELAPGSKARLVELERTGARLELANGSVKVYVVPQKSADFRLDAGPYRVHVTGTRFESSYSPERDAFELFLEEGQVELEGCVFGKGRKLAAGQSVSASCAKQTIDVSYGHPRGTAQKDVVVPSPVANEQSAPASPAPVVSAPTGDDEGPGERRPAFPDAARAPADVSWLALARAGSYEEAFSVVEARGFEAECARASSDTLALLADVARHAGAPRRAEYALLALRRRFPGSGDAALAAFALGRLEFDEHRAYPRAATWFRTYLSERPSGPMAREALGRLIEARYRAQDTGGARAASAQYLREYPSGPHAELASRIVSSP